ncbi:MAG TPA: radical SAM family heme chaperone HemW [Methylomirabilota bacterium]|nr:radical SAM family heme chaperone HemW [Methylomirabilota bacterium]
METRALHSLSPEAGDALRTASPRDGSLGFYLHVPFCTRRCHYCSFNTSPLEDEAAMRRFLAALRAELDLLAALPWAGEPRIASVFFGGGTPSLLGTDAMADVLDALRARFALATDAEITVECNPESVERDKLSAYRAAGVNRISLGVQSLDDAILSHIGRLHDRRGARAAFEAARAAGHDNVSVDLMYGLPGLDVPAWARAVEAVLDWGPEHLSAYGLTLDAGSLWGASGVTGLPPEDDVVAQYWTLARAAAARGYEHYEISNYARPGCRSRHNLTYWRAGEYLAAGPGACGHVGGVRYGNVKPLARYCALVEDGRLPVDSVERPTPAQQTAERLFLGLRTADGVPATWLAARADGDASLARRLEQWRRDGRLVDAGGRVRLSEAGFLVSDALFVDLL